MVNPASFLVACNATANPFPFSPGFDIALVASVAQALPSHSWEFGTASEALLELFDPLYLGLWGDCVSRTDDSEGIKIVIGTGANGLSDGEGAVGDPASLGVSAVLLGKSDAKYANAVKEQIDYIINSAPRFWNGAISHRVEVAELWADFIYMAPPFLAYAAADTGDLDLLHEAYLQCGRYRQILQRDGGVWEHIIGPQHQDTGLWSTSNAWAAAGMARVLATVMKAPVATSASWRSDAICDLSSWIKEIIDDAMSFSTDGGLLRNYLDNTSGDGQGFGEISGTSMLAAVAYRMVVLRPSDFGKRYIRWAERIRATMGLYISSSGIAAPAVNPMNSRDTTPLTSGSPEGNNFVVLMYAAWRDCVLLKVCNNEG
ncbi:Unsaturated rhamnogalacturonyl hydrolase YesR [Mycena venus]|uniref:Unsaturated rhamnogalacturonyl hydrolase YesR n=1 Tax=Mycena venus TaxID=2733690 RepID=A0A8H7CB09_9AGAR|nr:Unsaturated rhamnogalacturonyl hydrolase YesR [Mycena venus]